MHSNGHWSTKNAFREHSSCTQNAFVSESDWQANAFKWSFASIKVHVVSIQTVPENAFASVSDWHFNGDLEHQSAFREHSNCARNAFVSESDWQRNAFQMVIWSTKNAIHEHPICARNAFVAESDWQANAFIWSFRAPQYIS